MKQMYTNAFTLTEILVVVAIIGLLASVVAPNINDARSGGLQARAEAEMSDLADAIALAKAQSGLTLEEITGSSCSECDCRDIQLQNLPETHLCFQNWLQALERIEQSSNGLVPDIQRFQRDPWGAPYLLDENELEFPDNPCRRDKVLTAGQDGIIRFGSSAPENADNYVVYVPFTSFECR